MNNDTVVLPDQRVVVNRCYGGFQLSDVAKAMYKELRAAKNSEDANNDTHIFAPDLKRDDPLLLAVVDAIGLEACSVPDRSSLKLVMVPGDVPADGWVIEDYDGMEWVAEKHRIWCASEQK